MFSLSPELHQQLAKIKLIITDIDGVWTDGSLFYTENGESYKQFNVRDGLGVKMLLASGIQVAVISGGRSPILARRLADLGVPYQYLGHLDKHAACLALFEEAGVKPEEVAYVGDDSLDLPAFALCSLAVAVADAPRYIQNQAAMVLETAGGHGAFRELADKVLFAQGKSAIFETADGFLQSVSKMGHSKANQ